MSNSTPAFVATLLKTGANPKSRSTWGVTPLDWAVFGYDNRAVFEALLERGAKMWNVRNEEGFTPLHWAAAFNQNPAVITTLVVAGADPKTKSKYGLTLLHVAAALNRHPNVTAALLEAGAPT